MSKKIITIVAALAVVLASSFVFSGDSAACDGEKSASAKTTDAKASCCSAAAAKTASAKKAASGKVASTKTSKASCSASAAKTASASGCTKDTAANASVKTASTGSCCSSAASAKTASAAGCDKNASAASVAGHSGCDKSASAAHASANGCDKSNAASVASNDCKAKNAEFTAKEKAALLEVVDALPYRDAKRLVLAGSMECGKCSYKAVDHCAPLFKTADGKVYPLMNTELVKKMRNGEASEYEVSTRVRNLDGIKYLEVKAFKAL